MREKKLFLIKYLSLAIKIYDYRSKERAFVSDGDFIAYVTFETPPLFPIYRNLKLFGGS